MSIRQVGERKQPNGTSVVFVEVIDELGGRVVYEAHCPCQEEDALPNLGQFEHLQAALDHLADHPCDRAHKVSITEGGGKWWLHCPTCGPMAGQDYEGDAEAIAARHEEIGGFER